MLVQSIFITCPGKDNHDIHSIMETYRQSNDRDDISGIVLNVGAYYVNLFEGTRSAVSRLYTTICKSDDFSNSIIIKYSDIRKKEFGDNPLSYVHLDSYIMNDVNLLLPRGVQLDYDTLQASKIVSMFRRVSAHIQVG